jgi:hypothetical protein
MQEAQAFFRRDLAGLNFLQDFQTVDIHNNPHSNVFSRNQAYLLVELSIQGIQKLVGFIRADFLLAEQVR